MGFKLRRNDKEKTMNCHTSSYTPRLLAVAAIAVLAVGLSGVPAQSQILFTSGFSAGQLCPPPGTASGCQITVTAGAGAANNSTYTATVPSVPGTASGTSLQLTPNTTYQSSAAWFNTQQQIAGGFGVEFQFQIFPNPNNEGGTTGDGFAFVIQNSSSGLAAIGGWGGGIGYGTHESDTLGICSGLTAAAQYSALPCAAISGTDLGIPSSVAIEFDTYRNMNYDPDADHVAIQSCGTGNNSPDHNSPCVIAQSETFGALPITLADGVPHYAQIVYLPFSSTCPQQDPKCMNLSVYIDPATHPVPVVQAHVDLNNPCTAAGCPPLPASGTILNSNGTAWVGFTAATGGAQEEADILNFTFSPSITLPLQGSGVTNSFVFPFATYNVTYPADVPVTNTTMTVTPTLLPQFDCNQRIDIPAFTNIDDTELPGPTCTTFAAAGGDAVIFDVACAMGTNQPQGELCPTTGGFNPLDPAASSHSNEDISNIVVYADAIPAGIAPQFLTATEGTNGWVPIGVGFAGQISGDPARGGGTNNYQSQMVLADFPGSSSPFAIPPYQFIGFASPVTNQGNNVLNVAQAGQTIPLKWQLNYPTCPAGSTTCFGYNGGPVTNSALFPAGYLTILAAQGCSFAQGTTPPDETIPVDNESQTGLINHGNGSYQFNWKTLKKFSGECLTATVDVGDGAAHNADFQFK
jgi:hypothetical protein